MNKKLAVVGLSVALAGLSACGGGGGGSNQGGGGPTPTYTIGGSVSGLTGSGLVLRNNGGNDLPVNANGAFTFSNAVNSGGAYAVTVATQPSSPAQTCTVANGSGTASANVTSVPVTCVNNPTSATIGGVVTGLNGAGLVLQNNGGDDLSVASNGTFVFNTAINLGAAYDVTVLTQPNAPIQVCKVTNGSGASASGNVSNVTIACANVVPRFAYTWNAGSNTLSNYWVDAATGELHPYGYFKIGTRPIGGIAIQVGDDPTVSYSYTLNQTSGTITGNLYNSVTGVATPLAGSPYSVGAAPSGFVVHPSKKFVYVVLPNTNQLSAFAVDAATGALAPIAGSPFATGTTPLLPTFDPSGKFMYVVNQGANNIYVYDIDQTTGEPNEIAANRTNTGTKPLRLYMTSSGDFAYVANNTANSISAFSLDSTTGGLTPITGSPFATGITPSLVASRNGRFLYTLNNGSASVSGFAIDSSTGVLTQLGGSPYTTDALPFTAVSDATANFLYVGNAKAAGGVPGSVSTFAVDANTGVLTAVGSPISTGPFPAPAPDPSGKFLYVSSVATNSISGYNINQNTGALTPLTTLPTVATGNGPQFAFISPSTVPAAPAPKYLYLGNDPGSGNGTVATYAMNPTTGLVTPQGSPVATKLGPDSVAATPNGKFVYVANNTSGSISAYSSSNGALTEIAGSPFITAGAVNPHYVTVDAGGRFLFVAHDSTISSYAINATTGALTWGGTFAAGNFPETVAVDANLRCVFAANNGSNNISVYTVNTDTGFLTAATGSPFATASLPIMATIDPSGRFLYVASDGTNSIAGYSIAPSGCGLTPVAGSPFPVSSAPNGVVDIQIEPHGKFAYAANEATGTVTTFSVNQSTGALTAVGSPLSVGSSATGFLVEISGKFLIVGNVVNGTQGGQVYTIDPNTGALTLVPGSHLATPNGTGGTLTGDIQ